DGHVTGVQTCALPISSTAMGSYCARVVDSTRWGFKRNRECFANDEPTIPNVITPKRLAPLLLLVCVGIVQAQEIKFIDLSNIRQRTELRSPPAPQNDCVPNQPCVGGGYGGGSVADG